MHSESGRQVQSLSHQGMIFKCLLVTLLISCSISAFSSPNIKILFTIAWELWNARNAFVSEGAVVTVADICQKAASMAVDFLDMDS